MEILIGVLIGLLVINCILLVLIILIQDDGSEGAGIILGSAASQQYGIRKGNIVTRTTSILAFFFIVISFSLAVLFKISDNSQGLEKSIKKTQESEQTDWWKIENNSNFTNNAEKDSKTGSASQFTISSEEEIIKSKDLQKK